MAFEAVNKRLVRFRALLKEKGLDAFVLLVLERHNTENCHYLSGFRGSSAALVVDRENALLVTDGRYRIQAAAETPFEVVIQSELPLPAWLAKAVKDAGWRRVGFEAEKVSHRIFSLSLEPVGIEWVDASELIPSLRRAKDAEEVEAIRRAALIGRQAYGNVLRTVRPGMTEAEFEGALLLEIKRLGAEKGWAHDDFIVASGARGAICHAHATSRAFEVGDVVTVDYGAMVGGYMSDITRNFAVGRPDDRALEVNDVLLRAHRAAAAALRPGIEGREADAIARRIIAEAGYGRNFVHSLGHGLGLEVHETPRLSATSKDVLQAGDVVTVEPGIYIEGWGGLRIEDDYLITQDGAECLTATDNQSLEVVA